MTASIIHPVIYIVTANDKPTPSHIYSHRKSIRKTKAKKDTVTTNKKMASSECKSLSSNTNKSNNEDIDMQSTTSSDSKNDEPSTNSTRKRKLNELNQNENEKAENDDDDDDGNVTPPKKKIKLSANMDSIRRSHPIFGNRNSSTNEISNETTTPSPLTPQTNPWLESDANTMKDNQSIICNTNTTTSTIPDEVSNVVKNNTNNEREQSTANQDDGTLQVNDLPSVSTMCEIAELTANLSTITEERDVFRGDYYSAMKQLRREKVKIEHYEEMNEKIKAKLTKARAEVVKSRNDTDKLKNRVTILSTKFQKKCDQLDKKSKSHDEIQILYKTSQLEIIELNKEIANLKAQQKSITKLDIENSQLKEDARIAQKTIANHKSIIEQQRCVIELITGETTSDCKVPPKVKSQQAQPIVHTISSTDSKQNVQVLPSIATSSALNEGEAAPDNEGEAQETTNNSNRNDDDTNKVIIRPITNKTYKTPRFGFVVDPNCIKLHQTKPTLEQYIGYNSEIKVVEYNNSPALMQITDKFAEYGNKQLMDFVDNYKLSFIGTSRDISVLQYNVVSNGNKIYPVANNKVQFNLNPLANEIFETVNNAMDIRWNTKQNTEIFYKEKQSDEKITTFIPYNKSLENGVSAVICNTPTSFLLKFDGETYILNPLMERGKTILIQRAGYALAVKDTAFNEKAGQFVASYMVLGYVPNRKMSRDELEEIQNREVCKMYFKNTDKSTDWRDKIYARNVKRMEHNNHRGRHRKYGNRQMNHNRGYQYQSHDNHRSPPSMAPHRYFTQVIYIHITKK